MKYIFNLIVFISILSSQKCQSQLAPIQNGEVRIWKKQDVSSLYLYLSVGNELRKEPLKFVNTNDLLLYASSKVIVYYNYYDSIFVTNYDSLWSISYKQIFGFELDDSKDEIVCYMRNDTTLECTFYKGSKSSNGSALKCDSIICLQLNVPDLRVREKYTIIAEIINRKAVAVPFGSMLAIPGKNPRLPDLYFYNSDTFLALNLSLKTKNKMDYYFHYFEYLRDTVFIYRLYAASKPGVTMVHLFHYIPGRLKPDFYKEFKINANYSAPPYFDYQSQKLKYCADNQFEEGTENDFNLDQSIKYFPGFINLYSHPN